MARPRSTPIIILLAVTMTAAVLAQAASSRQPRAETDVGSPTRTMLAAAAKGNAERGRRLFIQFSCFTCHGYEGQGGSYTGPRIAPNPPPWRAIAAFVRNPPGLKKPYIYVPFTVMPPFPSRILSDRDIRDIYAYLKSVPVTVTAKEVPSFKP